MKFLKTKIFFLLSIIGSTALFGQKKPIVLDEIIAIIGDEIATKSELEGRYASYLSQKLPLSDNTKCEVLEDILFSKILLNQSKLDSVEITDGMLEGELDRKIRYYIGLIGSEQALEDYYKKPVSQIKSELRGPLKEQLLVQSVQSSITSGVVVTPEEVREYFNSIPTDSLPLINAEVEMAQIVINVETSKKAKDDVKAKLNEYKKRIAEGEKFSTLAVLYSEDQGSAVKGGEIGFVGKAEVEPEYGAAAFKLKEGGVSPIIETRYGFHIIQLVERRGNKINTRHILLKPKQDALAYEKAKEELDSIATLIKDEKITFKDAAKIYSEDEESLNNGGIVVNPMDGSSLLPMDAIDPATFLVIDKMEVGDISEAVLLSDPRKSPGYRIIKLTKRTEPHRASLKKDYQKIKNAALAKKEQEVLQDWVSDAIMRTYIKMDSNYTQGCIFRQAWLENLAEE